MVTKAMLKPVTVVTCLLMFDMIAVEFATDVARVPVVFNGCE